MKNIVALFIFVTLTGCGVVADIHIEEQEEYFRSAIQPIHQVIPSNPKIVFNVSGNYGTYETEEIELTNIKVVSGNIGNTTCKPGYPKTYYYYCDVGIAYASYYKDRFDDHEKTTADIILPHLSVYRTTPQLRLIGTTKQKEKTN